MIAIEYKLKKKAMYAKREGEDTASGLNGNFEGNRKSLMDSQMKYERPLKEGEIRTFSNLVGKKDTSHLNSSIKDRSGSRSHQKLPAIKQGGTNNPYASTYTLPKSKHVQSQKDSVFLTNLDGSAISVENIKYQNINSVIFNKSELETRFQDKRVLKSQVESILKGINNKSQKSLSLLDHTLENHLNGDIKALSKENQLLTRELNELSYRNKSIMKQLERIPKYCLTDNKGISKEEKMQLELDKLILENNKLKERRDKVVDRKERLENIIEI